MKWKAGCTDKILIKKGLKEAFFDWEYLPWALTLTLRFKLALN
jgi:hypothetical protein